MEKAVAENTVTKPVIERKPYQAPEAVVLGSLHQLTLDLKVGAFCDITCYHGGSG